MGRQTAGYVLAALHWMKPIRFWAAIFIPFSVHQFNWANKIQIDAKDHRPRIGTALYKKNGPAAFVPSLSTWLFDVCLLCPIFFPSAACLECISHAPPFELINGSVVIKPSHSHTYCAADHPIFRNEPSNKSRLRCHNAKRNQPHEKSKASEGQKKLIG